MIQEQRKLDRFTVNGAIFSVLYDLCNGEIKGQADYMRMWKWSRGKVRQNWPQIEPLATLLHLQTLQPNNNHKNSLNRGKNKESQPNNNQHIDSNTITTIPSANPLPSASNTNLNKPKKGQTNFDPLSKEYKFSRRTLDRLKQFGVASPSLLTNEEKTVQNGAAIFDSLHRVDGHSWEEIARVLGWLLREDNENIQKRWFMSITKLRRPNDDGIKYFEVYQAKSKVHEAEERPLAISTTSTYIPSYSTVEQRDDSDLDNMTPEEEELMRRLSA